MTKKSQGRLNRDAAEKRREQAVKAATQAPKQIDPLTELAKAELAKIADQEEHDSLIEEEKALSGAGNKDLWQDVENTYLACNLSLAALVRTISDLNDRNVLAFMASTQQFIDRIAIFKADSQRFKVELEEIHKLHAHRLNDNTGPREHLAAIEIAEHYVAWKTRALAVLDRTMMELTAMYDEAGRRLRAAVERKRQEHAAAAEQATDASVEVVEETAPVEEVSQATAHHGHHTHGHHYPGEARTQVHVDLEGHPNPQGAVEEVVNTVKTNPRGLMSGMTHIDEAGVTQEDAQPVIEPITTTDTATSYIIADSQE